MSGEACVRLRPGRFMAWVEAGSVPTDLACQRWSFPSQVGGRMLWFVAETKRLLLASRAAAMRSWVTGSSRSVAASKRSERHVPGWGCVFRVAAARVCRRDHGALQHAVAGWSEPWAGPLPGGPRRAGTAESPWVRRPWRHAAGAGTRAMATFRGDSNSETLRTFAFSKRRGPPIGATPRRPRPFSKPIGRTSGRVGAAPDRRRGRVRSGHRSCPALAPRAARREARSAAVAARWRSTLEDMLTWHPSGDRTGTGCYRQSNVAFRAP